MTGLAMIMGLAALLPAAEALADGNVVVRQTPSHPPLPAAASPMRNRLASPADAAVTPVTAADPRQSGWSRGGKAQASARAFGSFGIPYTSVRVQDGPPASSATADNRLSTTYPYRTIGRLVFQYDGGQAHCSASLIKRSVMVTAAHCAADFGSNALFSGWTFRPGFYGPAGSTLAQQQPFGAWTTERVAVPATWLNGRDTGVGAARNNDLAVFIVSKSGDLFIGDVVGWMTYGWNNYSFTRSAKTKSLWTAAVTTLGYPGLMDGGLIMQRADGPTFLTTVRGALQMWQGNNFTGGSSGGPWVVNFGYRAANLLGGAVPGTASALNVVIGVTSWGSADPNAIKDNYSSQFAQNKEFPSNNYGGYGGGNIGALLQSLCSAPGPGGPSYAAQGYCD
ncbi:hypothetical protein [Aestuariivirga sp.]|uniref:trypsin-like serine peptidase n=1 Tax=Aestuariivirga sp. TaxID=2650926 RepID=UPI0025B99933|nr:hypothetical protein [Aestuariivirga sp.]